MITCDICKYWDRAQDGKHLGSCSSEKFVQGYDYDTDDIPVDGVHVEDDEGWGFFTGEKFGCIHGEIRPTPLAPDTATPSEVGESS